MSTTAEDRSPGQVLCTSYGTPPDTTRERLAMEFAGQDKRSVFEPHRVVLQRRDGAPIAARTTRRSRSPVISSRPRGTTFISPISPGRRCGLT